ncbi:MAG: hypothetical protein QG567_1208 [Campylobacterota bacterium]|nr:hypothetical protein [Campylobacterota bacterium]
MLVLQAEATNITVQEHNSFHNTNSRPILQMDKKRKMHALHKIDEKEVAQLVKNETDEEIISNTLTHKGNTLFYNIYTKNYIIELDAIDGTILKKVKK